MMRNSNERFLGGFRPRRHSLVTGRRVPPRPNPLAQGEDVFSEARGHPGRSSFNHSQRVELFLSFLGNRCCCGLEGRAPLNTFERLG